MTSREMQIEFERRITLMNPDFEIKEKLTSDTIFSFLNAATERFVRNNYLQDDFTEDNSRAQKKIIDSLKGLITRQLLTEQVVIKSNSDNCSTSFILPENYFLYIRSNSNIDSSYKIRPTVQLQYLLDEYSENLLLENNNGILLEQQRNNTGSNEEFQYKYVTPNKTIKEEAVEKILSTYYNIPILRNPYIIINSGTNETKNIYITAIHDVYTVINSIDLIYCRKPKKFNVIGVDEINVLSKCELPENVHMEIVELAVEMFITEAKYRLNMKQN